MKEPKQKLKNSSGLNTRWLAWKENFYAKKGKTNLQKVKVCNRCFSDGIVDPNCQCCTGKYKLIELELHVCNRCGNVIDEGQPPDTEFNTKQFEKLAKEN